MLKHLVTLWLVAFSSLTVSGQMDSQYGPNRAEFINLCQPALQASERNQIVDSKCFVYFMGLRNGLLYSEYRVIDRAALYHQLGADMPAGGEFNTQTINNARGAYDSPVFIRMDEHSFQCAKAEDPVALLQSFVQYLQTIKRNNGAQALLYEYIGKNYSGKCP